MIKKIEIENFKSIDKLELDLGRFNVFIGENGCGKTNILEAVAFGSSYGNVDDVSLGLKGIRVSDPITFKSGFQLASANRNIDFTLHDDRDNIITFTYSNSNEPYSKWKSKLSVNHENEINNILSSGDTMHNISQNILSKIKEEKLGNKLFELGDDLVPRLKGNEFNEWFIDESENLLGDVVSSISAKYLNIILGTSLQKFMIYAPENYFLRNYSTDTPYLQPLGTKGEGLLKLFKFLKKEITVEYKEIIEHLHLIDWFSKIEISDDNISGNEFKLTDAYMEEGIGGFDIRNANEGFFLLLFYITLFVSDYTPKFFAIDNIDTALNPKLCTKLIEILIELAKKHDKQVLITTQNPAILDGINLNDDEQRLMVVSRNNDGYTRVKRIEKKEPLPGEKSMKLSEQFLRGYIGGLPKNF